MTKQDLTNNIINEMIPYLNGDQLEKLKITMIKNMYDLEVVKLSTEVTVFDNDNSTYINRFTIEKRIQNLSESTIDQYVRETKKLLDFTNKNFKEIKYDDIIYYFAVITSNNKNLSKRYLNNKRRHIKAFFNWCCENEYISSNPFNKFKNIRCEDSRKEILTNKEIVCIKDSCKCKRDLSIIDFLCCTGLRVSECVSLNINDIDFEKGEVIVYGKKTRTWRMVFLDACTAKHLAEYVESRKDNNEALFIDTRAPHHRMTIDSMGRLVKKIGSNAGIRKSCTVHMFRRTLASKLYKKGMPLKDIAKILGHSVQTLERYYLVIESNDLKYSYDKFLA